LGAAIDQGFVALAVIGVVNSAISLFYYIRVVVFMWMREEVMGSEILIGPAMATVLVVTLVGSIAFGLYPQPLFEQAQAAAETLGAAAFATVLP